ncbi:MAG: heme ABC exporter ATP-binding protein CcmA [Proteobacteria bacterium]|nr:heme ABC exporter ATP-binding protein CcmA [Pseudomonadota bacterium]MBI3499573.1 heme ABC exporter ATP-binding protein CcmA [Pseudomonadota bacterium]
MGRDLACVRGERLVFSGLSFRLEPGQALVVSGANGSGKSSLLRLMAGLVPPETGWLGWGEVGLDADPDAHRALTTYLGHLDAVKLAFTAGENLRFWLAYAGREANPSALAAALDATGLSHLIDMPARFLSQGQRRRLALSRILASGTRLWLLDEPTNGLDAASVAAIEAVLARHRNGGGMVAAALHGGLALPGALRLDLASRPPPGPSAGGP